MQDSATWHGLVGAGILAARLYSPALSHPALAALSFLQQAGSSADQPQCMERNAPRTLRSDGAEAVGVSCR